MCTYQISSFRLPGAGRRRRRRILRSPPKSNLNYLRVHVTIEQIKMSHFGAGCRSATVYLAWTTRPNTKPSNAFRNRDERKRKKKKKKTIKTKLTIIKFTWLYVCYYYFPWRSGRCWCGAVFFFLFCSTTAKLLIGRFLTVTWNQTEIYIIYVYV